MFTNLIDLVLLRDTFKYFRKYEKKLVQVSGKLKHLEKGEGIKEM